MGEKLGCTLEELINMTFDIFYIHITVPKFVRIVSPFSIFFSFFWVQLPLNFATGVNCFFCFSGIDPEDLSEDSLSWTSAVRNYWSLLSPLIFSDHPKRPGDEDPSPPFNMLRNVLDMNAHYGGFNSALLESGKTVWVMNVVPRNGPNNLPLILDRGLIGVVHDWYAFIIS